MVLVACVMVASILDLFFSQTPLPILLGAGQLYCKSFTIASIPYLFNVSPNLESVEKIVLGSLFIFRCKITGGRDTVYHITVGIVEIEETLLTDFLTDQLTAADVYGLGTNRHRSGFRFGDTIPRRELK